MGEFLDTVNGQVFECADACRATKLPTIGKNPTPVQKISAARLHEFTPSGDCQIGVDTAVQTIPPPETRMPPRMFPGVIPGQHPMRIISREQESRNGLPDQSFEYRETGNQMRSACPDALYRRPVESRGAWQI